MKKIILLPLLYIGLLSSSRGITKQKNKQFVVKTVHKGFFDTTKKITSYDNDQEIGYLYYEQFPLSFFVIHTFFIQKKNRNQGQGTALLAYACRKLKKTGMRKVFIQPGPFERQGTLHLAIHSQERAQKIRALVRFYKRAGFIPAPHVLSSCAQYLYTLVGIDEDAHYLMIL